MMMMSGIGGLYERWIKNYSSGHRILLVGEGDFSFSLSLAMAFGSATNIVATTLDSYDALIRKYKDARENVDMLIALGASIWYRVDATQMKNHPDLWWKKFDRIVYNFPHAGFFGKEDDPNLIMMHKNLVRGFLQNASTMLHLDGEIHINHKTNAPFDSWKIVDLALECSLICIGQDKFNIRDYKWYSNKRGSGPKVDESFPLSASKTFKFKLNLSAQENIMKQTIMPSSSHIFAMPPLDPIPVNDVNSSINEPSECQILFGGYLNHVEESFGSDAFDVKRTVEEAIRLGFEMYAGADPGRPANGFISILEELHNECFEIPKTAADAVISRAATLILRTKTHARLSHTLDGIQTRSNQHSFLSQC